MTQLQALLTMADMEATASRPCVVPAGGLYKMIKFATSVAKNQAMHTAPRMALPRRTARVGKMRR